MAKKSNEKSYVVMTKDDWSRLQQIVARHPAALAELAGSGMMVQEVVLNSRVDLMNSDDEVVASYLREPLLNLSL